MLAEPFAPFSFSPASAAVYQLGPYGTAAKKLKEWDMKPGVAVTGVLGIDLRGRQQL